MRVSSAAWAIVVGVLSASACEDEVSTTGSGGAGGQIGAGGAGGGSTCTEDADCEGQYDCVFVDGACGESDPVKQCVEYGATCGESAARTFCGCDGSSYGAAAACVLESDTRLGACPPPAGQFYCGESLCALGQEYCGGEITLACAALPAACQPAGVDCTCFGTLTESCMCTQLADGHFELGCRPF